MANPPISLSYVESMKHAAFGEIDSHGSTLAESYQTWRASNLAFSLSFWTLQIVCILASLPNRKATYLEAVQALPPDVSPHASSLATFMFVQDLVLAAVSIISFGLTLKSKNTSQNQPAAVAFFLNTAAPFLALLVFAGRGAVDWDGASHSLCVSTFTSVMGDDGEFPQIISMFSSMLNAGVVVDESWGLNGSTAAIDAYCTKHGWDWSEKFFGTLSSDSAYMLDGRTEACSDVESMAVDPLVPDSKKLICLVSICSLNCASKCPAVACSLTPILVAQSAAYMGTMQVAAIMATEALRSSEFIVGCIMGLFTVKVRVAR
jgi:hypothetical protein